MHALILFEPSICLLLCSVTTSTLSYDVTTYLYDNFGLAALQQLQDLMQSRQLVGLLILGISALIAAISSVVVV